MEQIKITNLIKVYKEKEKDNCIFNGISLNIMKGDQVLITGESGVGKSTLLNIIGLMDKKFKGEYILNGKSINNITGSRLAKKRNQLIGIIPQNYLMIDKFTIYDNIAIPLYINKSDKEEIKYNVNEIAKKLDIQHTLNKRANEISGGERQRACIARAIVSNPEIVLADEPTASLDKKNKLEVIELIDKINANGITVIVATHDKEVFQHYKTIIKIENNLINVQKEF